MESVEPGSCEGRLAWQSRTPEGLEVYHAWLVQDLEGGRGKGAYAGESDWAGELCASGMCGLRGLMSVGFQGVE